MANKYKAKETPPEPEVITPVPEIKPEVIPVMQEVIEPEKRKPQRMTLANALARKAFDPDPDINFAIYLKKRRGHEGRERTTLVVV
jgi:hypothetical protein